MNDQPQVSAEPCQTGLLCLADVEPKPIEWLWEPYIPLGKLTMLEGDPGTMKSYLAIALAAAVTTGKLGPVGSVLYLAGEDGLRDTVRPRLDQRAANLRRVFTYSPSGGGSDADQMLDLLKLSGRTMAATLSRLVEKCEPRLIIVDPITEYMGLCSRNDGGPVRQFLAPLAKLTEDRGCATVLVRHLNKNAGQRALYRGGGSIDFSARCRSILQTGKDPENGGFVMAHTKHNVSRKGESMRYQFIEGKGVEWTGAVDITADELVSEQTTNEAESKKIAIAEDWLVNALSKGPRRADDLIAAAMKERGIGEKTLRKAKGNLKVHSKQLRDRNHVTGWEWRLPV